MMRLALVAPDEDREGLADLAASIRDAELVAAVPTRGIAELLRLRAGDLDAVLVHTSPADHAAACEAAAAFGKQVFVGAPLADSLANAERIVSRCRDAGVRCVVEQPARGVPSSIAVKESLAAGELGEPVLVRAHRWESAASAEISADIDLVHWWFGRSPERVFAVGSPPSYLQVHLAFSGGGMALVDVSARLPRGDGYRSASVIGTNGSAYADDHRNTQLLYRGGEPLALRTDERQSGLAAEWQAFVDTIAAGRDSGDSVDDAVAALAVAAAAAASATSGKPAVLRGGRYELAG